MKKRISGSALYWGVAFIAVALLLIFNAVGVKAGVLDIGGLPVLRIVLGVLLLSCVVWSLCKGKVAQIFFPLAFIALLFEKEIARLFGAQDENLYSVWLVLGVAALLTAGVALLFPSRTVTEPEAEKDKLGKTNFASAVKYIDCTDFGAKSVGNNLGNMEIYFENTEKYSGGGELYIGSNLGLCVVHLPESWNAELTVEHNLGGSSVPKDRDNAPYTVKITVKSNLGNIKIV